MLNNRRMATYCKKECLKIEQWKDWLVEDENSKFAKGRVCTHPKNRFALSNIGERALASHMKGKKYILCMKFQLKLNSFFQSKVKASKEQSPVDDAV